MLTQTIYKLSTAPADLLALNERFGWVSAIIWVNYAFEKWHERDVTGHITGQIVQSCIVTGAPVPENIDFQIEERYVRTANQTDQVEVSLDEVEPIKNGAIDIGELAVQSLCLAATAWPRVDDAPDCFSVGEQELDHPFAGLSALKHQNRE